MHIDPKLPLAPAPCITGVTGPANLPSPVLDFHGKFGRSASNGIRVYVEVQNYPFRTLFPWMGCSKSYPFVPDPLSIDAENLIQIRPQRLQLSWTQTDRQTDRQ